MSISDVSTHSLTLNFLDLIGTSKMSGSPYDTGWIARLGEYEPELSQRALTWLREHQLEDGSWGTAEYEYNHERFISTLSAMIALTTCGDQSDEKRIKRGSETLNKWLGGLRDDPGGPTIGFELIVPTLLDEAYKLGILKQRFSGILYDMAARRTVKVSKLPKNTINRAFTVAFSSEMIGSDAKVLLDINNLQEGNGSVAYSPAATTYFVLNVVPGDTDAREYLRGIAAEGSAPYISPIEVFELGWGLWNLSLIEDLHDEITQQIQPHLDFLESFWIPGKGISACAGLTLIDGDTTGIVYEVLNHYGRHIDLGGVLSYEQDTHFRCFPLEANPSISTNIHVLGALHAANYTLDHPTVQKTLTFLQNQQINQTYWYDKWHASPYYSTAHAVIAMMKYDETLVENAINWIISTQNTDGSWGYYVPTAEETAYALQSLLMWKRQGYDVSHDILVRGRDWLQTQFGPPYVPLWIGKSMYSPEWVVHGAVLSALILLEQEL